MGTPQMSNIPPPPDGFTLDAPQAASIPPPPDGFTLDSDGPRAEPGSLSLPTSLGDAAQRVQQGGLFRTPQTPGVHTDGAVVSDNGDVVGPDGQIDFSKTPVREGPLPSPAFLGNAVAGAIGKVGGMIPEGLTDAVAHDAGRFIPATVRYAAGLLPSAATMGRLAVQAAAAIGPRAEAIAHYLATQRDPGYAASLQKKDDK